MQRPDDPLPSCSRRGALGLLAASALVGACTTVGPGVSAGGDWHDVTLPGKRRTAYRWQATPEGRVLLAQADRSSSMYRKRIDRAPGELPSEVEFGWWVDALPAGGDVSDADAEDAAARVLFAFGGDHSRLSARNQTMFELARLMTGEAPPFATLGYVWDTRAPVGSTVIHPRTDRMRKIVVESGDAGLRQWKRYRRDLVDDYHAAFGEPPGPLLAVAFMTDGDNTGSRVTARYRDVQFR